MSTTGWIVLGVVGLIGVGLVVYLATRPSGVLSGGSSSGAGGTDAAGLVASIGGALTGIGSTIAGAVQQGERERAAAAAAESAGS